KDAFLLVHRNADASIRHGKLNHRAAVLLDTERGGCDAALCSKLGSVGNQIQQDLARSELIAPHLRQIRLDFLMQTHGVVFYQTHRRRYYALDQFSNREEA